MPSRVHGRSGSVALVRTNVAGAVPEMHRAGFEEATARRAGRKDVLSAEATILK